MPPVQSGTQSAMAVQAETPPNFSWVVDKELCAMGMPRQPQHMQFLQDQGVRLLVSLTAEASPPAEDFPDIEVIPIKIKDFTAPTLEQVEQFLAVVEKGKCSKKAVAVHCRQGKGRTAVMLACYFVYFSNMSAQAAIQRVRRLRKGSLVMANQADVVVAFQRHLAAGFSQAADAVGLHCAAGKGRTGALLSCYMVKHMGMTASEAIENVRFLRPGSVETTEQEELVKQFESHLKK